MQNGYTFILLQADFKVWFSEYIAAATLFKIAFLFLILTSILVLSTYYYLYKQKSKFLLRKRIKQNLEDWITHVIMEENPEASADFIDSEKFLKELSEPVARQIFVEELITHKLCFKGEVADKLVKLYFGLGLNMDSVLKLADNRQHIKEQGIHELAVMEQKEHVKKIYRFTNHKNDMLRMEAQSAIIQWFGFKGLRFLDVVSVQLTNFQQIHLLELLRTLHFDELPSLKRWLQSSNDSVVSFALKLAQQYRQWHVHDIAATCLDHPNEAIRLQAVKTIVHLAMEHTPDLLTKNYDGQGFTQKLNILNELYKIAGEEQDDFFIRELDNENEFLKLAAARCLANCSSHGLAKLEIKALQQPKPYESIYSHVKAGIKEHVADLYS